MMSRASEPVGIKVKFDNLPAQHFSAYEPSDYSSDLVFVEPARKFIASAKKAKHIIVEMEFYREGSRQFEFSTENLLQ